MPQFCFKAPWLWDNIRREAPEEDIFGCLPNQINPLFMQYCIILEWFLLGVDIVTRCYLGFSLIPLFQMCLYSSTWRFCAYAVLPPHVSHCLGTSSMWGGGASLCLSHLSAFHCLILGKAEHGKNERAVWASSEGLWISLPRLERVTICQNMSLWLCCPPPWLCHGNSQEGHGWTKIPG